MAKRKNFAGRIAIEWIKLQYRGGRVFADRWDLRDALATEFRAFQKCSPNQVVAWDGTSRDELYDEMVYVAEPVHRTGYEREPRPLAEKRARVRNITLRELANRLEKHHRAARAITSMGDATRAEIEVEMELRFAALAVQRAVSLM